MFNNIIQVVYVKIFITNLKIGNIIRATANVACAATNSIRKYSKYNNCTTLMH